MSASRFIVASVIAAGIAAADLALMSSPVAAQQVIKIEVVGPLTGDVAASGQSQLSGAEMRVKEINAAGGKWKIELLSHDDASDCNQSANITVKLLTQDKVAAIIGAVNSPCALAMVPLTQRYRVPQFTVGVGTAITQQGSEWVFRINAAAISQTKALVDFTVENLKKDKIAILYSDDEYGTSMANGMKMALATHGLQPAAVEVFPRADVDFTGQLAIVKRSGANALLATGNYTAAALIAKQARQLGIDLQLLGDTGLASPKYVELGGEFVENAVIVEPFTPADPTPQIQSFVKKYKEQYSRQPDGFSAEVYDTIGMILAAVEKGGKSDPKVIRDYIVGLSAQAPYKGLLGDWFFNKQGEAPSFPLYKVRIKDGQQVILAH